MPRPVCHLCDRRTPGCHAQCTDYLAERIIRSAGGGEKAAREYEIAMKRKVHRVVEKMKKHGRKTYRR